MRPVNLAPAASKTVKVKSGPGNETKVAIGIVVGGLLAIGVGAYFGFATINSVKQQTTQASEAATKADNDTTIVKQQIDALGQRKGYEGAGEAATQSVLASLNQRKPIMRISRELRALKPNGMWYETVNIGGDVQSTSTSTTGGPTAGSTAGTAGGMKIKIQGTARSIETIMALRSRLNASRLFESAEVEGDTQDKEVKNSKTGKIEIWRGFTIVASVTDSSSAGATGAQTVSNAPVDATSTKADSLALEPSPGYNAAIARKKAEAAKKAAEKQRAEAAKAAAAKPSSFESMSASTKGAS